MCIRDSNKIVEKAIKTAEAQMFKAKVNPASQILDEEQQKFEGRYEENNQE